MKTIKLFSLVLLLPLALGCERRPTDQDAHANMEQSEAPTNGLGDLLGDLVGEAQGVSVYKMKSSVPYPDAELRMAPMAGQVKKGRVRFEFEVLNYKLTEQSPGPCALVCNNSPEGKHIHHILNNMPYTAHYTDTFSKKLDSGYYVQLAFLSRSYHESIKTPKAFVLNDFVVGDPNVQYKKVDLKAPHMFYSRPKGEYTGKDTENILLDFYLANGRLHSNGNQVRLTINGQQQFMLTDWVPYIIRGLQMGENSIRLELLDAGDQPIPGPYNDVTRTITLKPAA